MQKICQIIREHLFNRSAHGGLFAMLICCFAGGTQIFSAAYAQSGSLPEIPDSTLRMRPSIGIVGGGNLNQHTANFAGLPGACKFFRAAAACTTSV
jgi:hypothetical protein